MDEQSYPGNGLAPGRMLCSGSNNGGRFDHGTGRSTLLPPKSTSTRLLGLAASLLDHSIQSHAQTFNSTQQARLSHHFHAFDVASTYNYSNANDMSFTTELVADYQDVRNDSLFTSSLNRRARSHISHLEDHSDERFIDSDGNFRFLDKHQLVLGSSPYPQQQFENQLIQHRQQFHYSQDYNNRPTSRLMMSSVKPLQPITKRAPQNNPDMPTAYVSKRLQTSSSYRNDVTSFVDRVGHEDANDPMDERETHDPDRPGTMRFQSCHAEKWSERFEELLQYKKENGHCCVPQNQKDNSCLARWVKRQRYQYKLFLEGDQSSTMTQERVDALDRAGFVWDIHETAWEARFYELTQFVQSKGHCNVPSSYSLNPQLATWVKCQRRQYKAYCDGDSKNRHTCLSIDRIDRLEALGFEWKLKSRTKER